jgi:rubrerythrin
MAEIILGAIEKERQAIKFYKDAANCSDDPTGKRILLYLALFEEGHERSLQIEFDAVAKYPQWFDTDGAETQPVRL